MSNNDDNKNIFGKRPRNKTDPVPIPIPVTVKKQIPVIYYDDINDLNDIENLLYNLKEDPLEPETENQTPREFVKIEKQMNSLHDLLELAKSYDCTKDYSLDMAKLSTMVKPLEELNNMIGMHKVKRDMVENILFYLQKLDDKNNDMLHTVIEGPPGVGKTELGKILGKIYLAMGILKKNIFKKVSRPDMVAKYLGQTAIKTEELIDSCMGGVMFIDEVYSLGNRELRDSFSKEAIDTLNLKLTEHKNEFICIVAGYEREIEECFFSYNPGLKSRFPIRFSIEPYTPKELLKIFTKIVKDGNWELDEKVTSIFFKKNYDSFKYFGRDMEVLFTKCKRAHSMRLVQNSNSVKKLITLEDIHKAYENFMLDR
jgi:SpoVK/Ycf46/Vps4 family AAA+-type ATPase